MNGWKPADAGRVDCGNRQLDQAHLRQRGQQLSAVKWGRALYFDIGYSIQHRAIFSAQEGFRKPPALDATNNLDNLLMIASVVQFCRCSRTPAMMAMVFGTTSSETAPVTFYNMCSIDWIDHRPDGPME